MTALAWSNGTHAESFGGARSPDARGTVWGATGAVPAFGPAGAVVVIRGSGARLSTAADASPVRRQEHVRRLIADGKAREALDVVFGWLDELLRRGDFAACDAALQTVELDGLDPMVALGFLVITRSAAASLRERAGLVERLRAWLPERVGPARAEDLLRRHG